MPRRSLGELQAILRSAGLRATPARLAVCRVVQTASGPLTHAEVADRLAQQGIDRTTVFRNLNDLCRAELLRRLEVGDHVFRFEWRDPAAAGEEHAHFVCVACGEVQCLTDDTAIQLRPPKKGGRRIGQVTEVLLRGHCRDCGA